MCFGEDLCFYYFHSKQNDELRRELREELMEFLKTIIEFDDDEGVHLNSMVRLYYNNDNKRPLVIIELDFENIFIGTELIDKLINFIGVDGNINFETSKLTFHYTV